MKSNIYIWIRFFFISLLMLANLLMMTSLEMDEIRSFSAAITINAFIHSSVFVECRRLFVVYSVPSYKATDYWQVNQNPVNSDQMWVTGELMAGL